MKMYKLGLVGPDKPRIHRIEDELLVNWRKLTDEQKKQVREKYDWWICPLSEGGLSYPSGKSLHHMFKVWLEDNEQFCSRLINNETTTLSGPVQLWVRNVHKWTSEEDAIIMAIPEEDMRLFCLLGQDEAWGNPPSQIPGLEQRTHGAIYTRWKAIGRLGKPLSSSFSLIIHILPLSVAN